MTINQASIDPIKGGGTLEIVTLKSIVALDLVEQTENILTTFNLVDTSEVPPFKLQDKLTTTQLQNLIADKQEEISVSNQELKDLKQQQQQQQQTLGNDPNEQLINSLSSEFLNDSIPKDDTESVIGEFEKQNKLRVLFDENSSYYRIKSINLQKLTSEQ